MSPSTCGTLGTVSARHEGKENLVALARGISVRTDEPRIGCPEANHERALFQDLPSGR